MAACTAQGRRATTPEELETYKSQHYASLPTNIEGTASNDDLLGRLKGGRILLLGDIHDDRTLHLLHAQILQQLIQSGQKLVLHIEFLGKEDEAALRDCLAGVIDLDELRQIVQERWSGSWMEFRGFDSGFYRRLIQTAREHGVEVLPLEPIPRLALDRRDRVMAAEISAALEKYPDRLHIVLIGHTHILGEGHLLARLEKQGTLALLPRGGLSLTHRLGAFASLHSAAWHAPYLVLDEELWLLNPLPLRSLGTD